MIIKLKLFLQSFRCTDNIPSKYLIYVRSVEVFFSKLENCYEATERIQFQFGKWCIEWKWICWNIEHWPHDIITQIYSGFVLYWRHIIRLYLGFLNTSNYFVSLVDIVLLYKALHVILISLWLIIFHLNSFLFAINKHNNWHKCEWMKESI